MMYGRALIRALIEHPVPLDQQKLSKFLRGTVGGHRRPGPCHPWQVCQSIRFSGGAHGILAGSSETCQACCDHQAQERPVEESALGCRHVEKWQKRAHVVVRKSVSSANDGHG